MNSIFWEDFRNHLYYYFIIRFFFIFTVVFSFFLFPFVRENTDIFSFSNKVFLTAAFVIVLLNIISLMINRSIPDELLPATAYVQFSLEIFFWVVVSYLSGGIESPYLYVIIINIVYSGILLRERGAIFTTLFAFIMLLVQGIVVKMSLLPLISTELVELYASKWETYFSRLFTYLLFFSFTGLVASKISKGFQQTSQNLFESAERNRELRKHFFAIFSNINMGIVILSNGRKVYYNKYASQFTEDLDRIVDDIKSDPAARANWSEKQIHSKWFSYTVMPYVESQEVIIFSDVTEIRKREEAMEYHERMAAIGRLTASKAHEIKNPLASLIGASELMFSEIDVEKGGTEGEQLINIVQREGQRVKTLLDSLFRYTEEIRFSMNDWSIVEIITDVEKLFRIGNPDIELSVDVDNVKIYVDYDRMKEVIWNILLNSAEAMQNIGQVRIFSELNTDSIKLYFDDNGPGFDENSINKIFDPFFSTKKRGTGLGLAQVYRVITKFGGTVRATNTEEGARIEITLKRIREA